MIDSDVSDHVSDDQAFLDRAEALRLQQAWSRDLDMRQYVSAPCKRYRYRQRVYWLDAHSRRLFVEGLQRDGGVFTVATCETILAAVESKANQDRPRLPVGKSTGLARFVAKQTVDDTSARQLHEVVKLGYFVNRRQDRFKYSTRVLLIGDGPISPGRTRDISEGGLQVRVSFLGDLQVGGVVQVKFPDLPEGKSLRIPYQVVRIVQQLGEFVVSLRCEEESPRSIVELLRSLGALEGEGDENQAQIDLEDAVLTAESLLAERHYMCSTALIPFFLARSGLQRAQITVVSHNEVNKEPLFAYQTMVGGNTLAEALNQRHLRHLIKLAKVDGQILAMLAVWQSSDWGNLETLLDMACKTDTDWYAALAKHRHDDAFRVFRVIVRRVRRPKAHRLPCELEPLAATSPGHAKQLLRDGRHLVAVGALMDCTAEVRSWNLTPYESVPLAACSEDEADRRYRGTSKPELIPIQYVEKTRSHSRYLLQMPVTLEVQGRTIEAVTSDISHTGLSISLPAGTPPVAVGAPALVTLSGLMAQAGILARLQRSFVAVLYQVVSIGYGKDALLRLRLQDPERQRGFTRALSMALNSQKSALSVERSHAVQAVESRLYSCYFVEASVALPVLYFRAKAHGSPLAKVGLTRKPSPLTAFFETADGKFDFSAITAPAYTARLWEAMQGCGRGEMNVFLIKERIPNQPRYRISAVADYEFADRGERAAFLEYAVGREFRIVKIVMLPLHTPSSREREHALEGLAKYSARRAEKLGDDFDNLVAVGDVADVTTTSNEMRYIAP